LVATGSPVLGGPGATTSPGARFSRIAGEYAGVVGDYHVCGLHVHVGVPDRDTAVAVVNHLRPWLPALLALSANSPFRHGADTGYASWRMIDQSRFPGAGVPPRFASADAYDRQVAQLVECGALIDDHMTFWLARPSPHLPTVELRVADSVISVAEAALQAALSRALVRTALADLARGREAPALGDQLAAAALWTAARYGLDGPAVHPVHKRRMPARRLVAELIEHLTPALAETGDLSAVRQGIATLDAAGTGARRQRAAAGAGPMGVLRMLAAETAGETPADAR
ncbi:MAG TPA: YbdK family carboxylate-amine ligase, partial [Actinophytocola sp.]|uniref:carboxylate-amine ligase n=1 Tax=Actinophytocola sp. TaxID=1872138 RepID=UPI002DDD6FAC